MNMEAANFHDWCDRFPQRAEGAPLTSLRLLMGFEPKPLSIDHLEMSNTLRNLLLRHGITDVSKMVNLSLRELMKKRGMGPLALSEFFQVLCANAYPISSVGESNYENISQVWEWCLQHFPNGFLVDRDSKEFPILKVILDSDENSQEPIIKQVDLTEVKLFNEFELLLSSTLQLDSSEIPVVGEGISYELILSLEADDEMQLASLPTKTGSRDEDLLNNGYWILDEFDTDTGDITYLTPLEDFLEILTDRESTLLSKRLGFNQSSTLDDIGAQYNLSRERIRQIEKNLIERINEVVKQYGSQYLDDKAIICKLESLDSSITQLRSDSKNASILDLFIVNGRIQRIVFESLMTEWLVINEIEIERISKFNTFDSLMNWIRSESPPKDTFVDLMQGLGVTGKDLDLFMRDFELEFGQDVVRRIPRRLADKLRAAMVDFDRPLDVEDIKNVIGTDWTLRSAINLMSADPSFMTVDLSTYALSEWGLREYRGIREEILGIVDDQGPTSIDEILDLFAEWFPKISTNSIKTYASSLPLQMIDGLVSRRDSNEIVELSFADLKPRQLRNIFKCAQGFKFRIEINSDHLRGSGFPVSRAVGSIVGVNLGQNWSMPIERSTGVFNFYNRGNQAALGSIRSTLLESGGKVDDFGYLTLVGEIGNIQKVEFELLSRDELSDNPEKLALQMVGQDIEAENILYAVLESLNADTNGNWFNVETIAAKRGDVLLERAARLVQIKQNASIRPVTPTLSPLNDES